jgi:sortase A
VRMLGDDTEILPVTRIDSDATRVLPVVAAGGIHTYPAGERPPGEYRWRHAAPPRWTPAARHRTIRVAGELMVTFGLVMLLFCGYEIWGKAVIIASHQADLDQQLAQEWGDPTGGASSTLADPSSPTLAGAIARLYIPRLGKHWVVVQGVTIAAIRYAPGHYPNTAMPGQIGNFSVAGHRSPAIFWNLDWLRRNDPIIVETRSTFYIYRVTQTEIVAPNAFQVIAPVPDQPGRKPTVAMLTLTTCNPKWDNFQRLIVHAQLVRSQPRTAGSPAELRN